MKSETNGDGASRERPMHFALGFLENQGAVIDHRSGGWEALLPDELAAQLNVPEHILLADAKTPLTDESSLPAFMAGYGSDFLDRMISLACRSVSLVSWRLRFHYLKTEGFERLIDEQMSFMNALVKLESRAQAFTEYYLATFWYEVQSDEIQEGLVEFAYHPETGASIPAMIPLPAGLDRVPDADSPVGIAPETAARIVDSLLPALRVEIHRDIEGFKARMNRRYHRDVSNLVEYYESLEREMRGSLDRSGLSEQLVQDRLAKIALLPDELNRKQEDLKNKYEIRVQARPCVLTSIKTPVVKLHCRARIARQDKTVSLLYNPTTKMLDPLACMGCGASTFRIAFCDERHLLCSKCAGACPVCTEG